MGRPRRRTSRMVIPSLIDLARSWLQPGHDAL